jgi:hypothetical protein
VNSSRRGGRWKQTKNKRKKKIIRERKNVKENKKKRTTKNKGRCEEREILPKV